MVDLGYNFFPLTILLKPRKYELKGNNVSFWGVGGKNDHKPYAKKGKEKEKGEKGKKGK